MVRLTQTVVRSLTAVAVKVVVAMVSAADNLVCHKDRAPLLFRF